MSEQTPDDIAAAYEARVAAVPEAARRFAAETWGETWAHAEMGSLLDFAALISAAPALDLGGGEEKGGVLNATGEEFSPLTGASSSTTGLLPKGEAPDGSSSQATAIPSRVEFRLDPLAPSRPDNMLPILDEAIIHGASVVHAEMMGDHDLWIGVDCVDGRHVRLLVFIEDGKLRLCGEDEGGARVRDRSGEAGETTGSPEGKSPADLSATPSLSNHSNDITGAGE